MNYEYILFDLDGTLTDSAEGITKSFKYALNSFGIEVGLEDLRKHVGPPLKGTFKDFYNFSDADVEKAVAKYREYFVPKGMYQNKLIDGMEALLEALGEKTLILATSKVTVYAEKILETFGILKYFKHISGSELDGSRGDKGEVIKYALEMADVKNTSSAVIVGDTKYDIIGAKQNSIASIGVLFGYGTEDELKNAGADYIVKDVYELKKILLG